MALTYRDEKGSPLTSAEADSNIRQLDTRLIAVKQTADAAKSTADLAQPKVAGKGLSTNDYDNTEKAKVAAAIPNTQKGSAGGVATLGADGKLPVSQLPPLAVNEVFTVASQAEMLALTAERGDGAIRTDQNGQWYVLTTDTPSVLANWKPITQNLGVALTALGALTPAANTFPYFNGTATAATTTITFKARQLLARSDAEGMRTEIAAAVSGANGDITSLSGLTTALSVEQGGTGVKTLPVIFTRLRDSQNLTYAEAASERIRMKIFEPVNFVTNTDDVSNAQVRGPGYVTTTTTGTIPGGSVYGVLNTTIIPGDVANQEFVPLSGAAGITFPAYRRTGYGSSAGRWGPWRMIMDSATSLLDPNSGGLMSSAVIGGYLVQKFANGQMCVQGQIASPLTNPVPPNATVQVNVGLPVSFVDITNSTVKIDLPGPSVTHEHFGFTVAHLSSASGILSYFRNGPESQTTGNLRITVWGRWK